MKDRLNNYNLVTSVAVATLLSLGLATTHTQTVKADTTVQIEKEQKNKSAQSSSQNNEYLTQESSFQNSNVELNKDNADSSSNLTKTSNIDTSTKAISLSDVPTKSADLHNNNTKNNITSQLSTKSTQQKNSNQLSSDAIHEGMNIKNGYTDNGFTYVDPDKASPERKSSYHLTTDQGWSNDLQTIIYDPNSKEYRLYFLHSADGATDPFGSQGQNWNEADSKDLIHFSSQVDALPATNHEYANNPNSWKSAWTGSVIKNNGLITGVPKDAYVTYFSGLKQSDGSQNIWAAWSDDSGKTFKHVLNNGSPILDHSWNFASKDPGQERDAGVFYYNDKMIMYTAEGDKLGAYQSKDGITWTKADPNGASKVGGGSAMPGFTTEDIPLECPAIRFMKNSNDETKAVLFLGGKMPQNGQTTGTYYTVGHLDANGLFANETSVQRLDLGSDFYGANFSGSVDYENPSDSIIGMGWVGNWSYTSSGVRASQKYPAVSDRLGSYSLARKLVLNADNTISSAPITTGLEERNQKQITKTVNDTPIDNSNNHQFHNVIDLKDQPANSKYILEFSTKDDSNYQGAIKLTFKQGNDYNEFIYDPTTGKVRQSGFSSELSNGAADYYKNGLYYDKGYLTNSGVRNQKKIKLTIFTDRNSIELFFPNGKAYTVARFSVNNIQDFKVQSQSSTNNETATITYSEIGPELIGYNTVNDSPVSPVTPTNPNQSSNTQNSDNNSESHIDIPGYLNTVGTTAITTNNVSKTNSSNDSSSSFENNKAVIKTIFHNSYIYNQNGKRINFEILSAGSKVATLEQKTINGISYYVLNNHHLIKANNIDGIVRKLRRTSFVYNRHGKRIKKLILKKGKKVRTYGSAVTINHKQFYIIGKNQFVKKNNF